MVDGSSRLGAFVRILLPLVAPGLVATSVFAFIQAWNEYIFASVLLTDQTNHTRHGLALVLLRHEPEHGLGRADGRLDADRDPRGRLLPPRPAADRVRADVRRGQGVSRPRSARHAAALLAGVARGRLTSPRARGRARRPAFAAVIPQPLAQAPERGAFALEPVGADRRPVAGAEARARRAAARRARSVRRRDIGCPVSTARGAAAAGSDRARRSIPGDRALGDEGYRLVVAPAGVTLTAPTRRRASSGARRRCASSCPPRSRPRAPSTGPWHVPRGDDPRPAALRVARGDARRRPPLLRRRRGQAAHRPDGALQAQPPAPAPDRRPGLAHRDPLVAAAHERTAARTAVGGGPGGYYTQREYARDRRATRAERFVDGRARDRHAGARQRRARRPTAELTLRRRRAGAVHGHRGRLQLALHRKERHLRVRRRRRARGRGAHAGRRTSTSAATRRTRPTPPTTPPSSSACSASCARHGKRMVGWEEIARAQLHRTLDRAALARPPSSRAGGRAGREG